MPTSVAILKIARLEEQCPTRHLQHSSGPSDFVPRHQPMIREGRHSHYIEDHKSGEYIFVVDMAQNGRNQNYQA